jgi:DNA primase
VFPVLDDRQRVVGFIGRRSPEQDDPVPKYLNTRGTEVYQKGRLLYGLGHQLDRLAHGATPVIVEGPMDVWALWRAHKWAGADVVGVAPGGTALTGEQLELLARHTSQPVVVGFDADQAGRHAMLVAWDKIRLTSMATTARAVEWPAGQDPASMSPRGVAEHLEHTQPMGIAASVTRLSQWDRHPDDPIRTIYQVRAAAQRDAGHLDADGLISWISQVAQVVDADPLWIQEILLDSRLPTGDAPVPPGSARDEQTRPGQLAADPGSAAARVCFPRSPTPSQAGVSDLHQPAGDWQVTLTQQPDLGR